MSRRDDERLARSLFGDFREAPGTRERERVFDLDLPTAAASIGHVEFIGYVTTHRGRTFLYIHEFAEGSRPRLAAGRRRGQLFLVGGRYKFTRRGITDLDPSGRPIDAPSRYKVTAKRRR